MSQSHIVPLFEEFGTEREEREIANARNIKRDNYAKQNIADEIQDDRDDERAEAAADADISKAMEIQVAVGQKLVDIVNLLSSVDKEIINILYDHLNDIYIDDGNTMDRFTFEVIDAYKKL